MDTEALAVQTSSGPDELTVVVRKEDVAQLAAYLSSDHGWWYFKNILSANGIEMYFHAEREWEQDDTTGTAWACLSGEPVTEDGYVSCDMTRQAGRDVAAGLTSAAVIVPVIFQHVDDGRQVRVYFRSEDGYEPPAALPESAAHANLARPPRGPAVKRRTVPSRAKRRKSH